MQQKKLQVWLPLLFSLAMVAGMFFGYRMRDGMPGKSFFYLEKKRPLQEIMDLVETKYVDDVNIDKISDTAIQALLGKLDPHSSYIPAESLESVNEDINGSFFGIGIEFNLIEDTLHVVNVLPDGPSARANLQTGDRILKAGDSAISGKKMTVDRIRKILRGPLNSKVTLTLLRQQKIITIDVTRDIIPIPSLDAAYMMDAETGYIRLNKFSSQTYREFMTSLMMLKQKHMKSLILDLRDNGGGVLDEAVEIADEFLDGDKLITYTEGRHTKKKEYRCRRQGQFETGKLIVLANEGTASASEILIGALQDWDRATVVGRRTFGKGLVQEQFNLSNNSAVRLTIARYYTPVGRSIQRSYANGGKAYYESFYNRAKTGELVSADSIHNDTSLVYHTHAGKKIYGGGGITPDYFVGADTSGISLQSAQLLSSGIIPDFGYRYLLSNPGLMNKYPSSNTFVRQFNLDTAAWAMFNAMAKKDTIDIRKLTPKDTRYVSDALKSSIARQLYRLEGYFESINPADPAVIKALELVKQK